MPVVGAIHLSGLIAAGLALLLATICLWGYLRLRGTTLTAPCIWGAICAVSLAFGSVSESMLSGVNLSAFQFAVAATTFCPLMAVLGAKRPQDRGWQWIVLSLWVILVWPAAQAALMPAGVRVDLFAAWKMFLWGLIGLGLLNYLPTRHWMSALLVAAGQIALLKEHLGFEEVLARMNGWLVGLICFVIAAPLIYLKSYRPALPRTELDKQWLSFRDSYGAFWALRVLGRVNHAAELRGWPLVLHWGGFVVEGSLSDEQIAELRQTMETLLRRFVDTGHLALQDESN